MRRMKNLRLVLVLCVIGTGFLTVSLWSRCDISKEDNNFYRETKTAPRPNDFDSTLLFKNRGAQSFNHVAHDVKPIQYQEIECVVNGDYSITGRREGSEVYMPFSFIQNYFEVYGQIAAYDGYDRFELQHSYSKVHPPSDSYSPDGVFMSFVYYNVEERTRVKCITAMEGVPISTQWTPAGHYYPIQIAQFGLSHYSKFLKEEEPDVILLEEGEEEDLEDWALPDKRSRADVAWDNVKHSNVVEFQTSEDVNKFGVTLSADEERNFVLSLDVKFVSNGSITLTVHSGDKDVFRIHYVLNSKLVTLDGKDIYYGLGHRKGQWIHMTRDVLVDLLKGLSLKYSKIRRTKVKQASKKLAAISFRGHGYVDNVTLATAAHLDHFYDAADWLVHHQDSQGGWPIMVRRKLIPDVLELSPGWYSAMAQGQAMSLLVRAYIRTRNMKYLKAAVEGMKLFEISSAQGGVLTKYANMYDWYEEYPTTPSSFVLNGFIYSLFGLYDLKEVVEGKPKETARKLYDAGMLSLKAMLLMFDTGVGTFYDLRHITLGIAPNRARWDYHTTHINQLLQLSIIDNDPLFSNTAARWQDYMKGKLAPHN